MRVCSKYDRTQSVYYEAVRRQYNVCLYYRICVPQLCKNGGSTSRFYHQRKHAYPDLVRSIFVRSASTGICGRHYYQRVIYLLGEWYDDGCRCYLSGYTFDWCRIHHSCKLTSQYTVKCFYHATNYDGEYLWYYINRYTSFRLCRRYHDEWVVHRHGVRKHSIYGYDHIRYNLWNHFGWSS